MDLAWAGIPSLLDFTFLTLIALSYCIRLVDLGMFTPWNFD